MLEKPIAGYNPFHAHKQALLVKQNAGSDSAFFIDDMLQSRGYEVYEIGSGNCTRGYVSAAIDELAGSSTPNSRTFFYYVGHGFPNENGKATIVDAYPKGIDPPELFTGLGRIRGKKAVFVDSCLSGEFIEYLRHFNGAKPLIKDYVAFASTRRDGLSVSCSWNGLPDESRLGGRSVSNLVHWLYTNHCEYGGIHLGSLPIPSYRISPEEVQRISQMLPLLDMEKLSLDIQRIGDTDFEL